MASTTSESVRSVRSGRPWGRSVQTRATILAAAEAHGLRVSLAPLPTLAGAGNGWHVHTSLWRGGENLLAGGPEGPRGTAGAGYVAGLLRDLPAVAAVTAPSIGSLARLRPGFFAGAFGLTGWTTRTPTPWQLG